MADDLDVHTVEALLAMGFLPNLQTYVVGRGVRFAQSFVSNSLCCPSRSTYLSGRYSHNHGVLRTNAPNGSVTAFTDPNPFDPFPLGDRSTVATWLRAAGYRTAHVGKYLNGYGSFAMAAATSPLNPHYVPPGWNRWEALIDPSTYDVYGYWMSMYDDLIHVDRRGRLRPPCPAPGASVDRPPHCEPGKNYYQTTFLAERAASVILEAKIFFPTQPLFLTVTPLAPHVELRSMKQINYPGPCRRLRPAVPEPALRRALQRPVGPRPGNRRRALRSQRRSRSAAESAPRPEPRGRAGRSPREADRLGTLWHLGLADVPIARALRRRARRRLSRA